MQRVILIVLDSVGIGELPDAALYGDQGSNTLGNIARLFPDLRLPNLTAMGLGLIDPDNLLPTHPHPIATYGKARERSAGKDTTTGHWEITGAVLDKPFPVFAEGFPAELIHRFEQAIGTPVIGNVAASGTAIIEELGDEHIRSRRPIVYTSADSVFQIAMHEAIYPIEKQYDICRIAREMLRGEYEVGRVICRPFEGDSGQYRRTSRRKDFSVMPPDTVLDAIERSGKEVYAVGKIVDIFAGKGISRYVKTEDNAAGMRATLEALEKVENGLIFTNLVDFDMLFGHRRDVPGYARALMEFDTFLPELTAKLREEDLLIITADHGNDPSFSGNDHTREYIPVLHFGARITPGYNIGERASFADIAATIAEALGVPFSTPGESYFQEICEKTNQP
ncbi:MAG TPA: phosphopentomutase [Saprospiraceae bacterium]|nr:phosphopentomutase [Saprospiraceae bacterium]